jgi:tRNA (uracil-5-)-methyltransferase TRM9
MDKTIQEKLLEINRAFYNHFAVSFSDTRGHVQPGVQRLVNRLHLHSKVLDIGCGNGSLARALNARGFSGFYMGVDMSASLLSRAKDLLGEQTNGVYQFRLVDLANPTWEEDIPAKPYDWIVAFAVLHHLPGDDFRKKIVRDLKSLLAPGGQVAVSVWQWQNSLRLRKRVLPWFTVGLHPQALDDGDVLIDWRAGKTIGLRYVHTFDEASLSDLANQAGFEVVESFISDGKSRDLALYQVWK